MEAVKYGGPAIVYAGAASQYRSWISHNLRSCVCSHRIRAQAQNSGSLPNFQTGTSQQFSSFSLTEPSARNRTSSTSLSCLTICRDILQGEVIEFRGTVLVKGDVCDGAAIHANGDIIVLGKLQGKAHAGISGDTHAVIFAWELTPSTLSIAGRDAGPLSSDGGHLSKLVVLSDNEVRALDSPIENWRSLTSESEVYQASASTLMGRMKAWFSIDINSVRKASKVAAFTGAYIFVVGIAVLLFPKSLFGFFFDVKSSVKEWIRVGAVLAMVFGIYYMGTAWGDAKGCNGANSFYISTIVGRLFIFFSFWWLAANGCGLSLFAVGTVNLIGALTMLNALRTESMQQRIH